MNRGKTANRRTIEQLTVDEELLIDLGNWKVEVLLHTGQVCESNIEELNVVVLDELDDLCWGLEHRKLPFELRSGD